MVEVSPLVSVIVPSYNHRIFIEQSLRSIEEQSYKNLELIVIDDGSTDGSADFLSDFIQKLNINKKIFIHQENQGAHKALNRGIELASGKYVTILNSDDFYQWDRIELFVKYFNETQAKIAFGCVYHIDEIGKPLIGKGYREQYFKNREFAASFGHSFVLLGYNLAVTSGNIFFHRDTFIDMKFEKYRTVHDWDFLLRAQCKYNIHFVKDCFMSYRIHSSNTIAGGYDDSIDCYEIQKKYLLKSEKLGLNLLKTPNVHNYPIFFDWFISTIYPEVGSLYKQLKLPWTPEKLSEDSFQGTLNSLNQFRSIRGDLFK